VPVTTKKETVPGSALRGARGDGSAIILEFEKGWLQRLDVGVLLVAAKLQEVAPQIALALNLDDLHST
jgi:hypothetical protein